MAALQTIPELVQEAAARRGDAEALVMPEERLTYAELANRVGAFAGGLQGFGFGPGDKVGICMANRAEWLIAWYAATWIGATAVPVNTRWKDDEVQWGLDHTDVRCLVFAGTVANVDVLAMFDRLRGRLPKVERFIAVGDPVPAWAERFDAVQGPVPPVAATPDSIGLIQFTSGSTSRPKGAMLSHRAMLISARGGAEAQGVHAGDRYFCPRPFFHVAGSVAAALLTLATGCCLVSIPVFDPALALAMLARERCNFTVGNDTMFLMLMNQPVLPDLPDLRGGYAAAGAEVHRLIRDRLGVPFMCSSYGMSEVCSSPALARWDDSFESRAAGLLLPYEGVEIRIRRQDGTGDCAIGEPGELLMRGPILMSGYYKQEDATAETIDAEGWLHSGDLAVPEPGGRFRYVGRLKDIIRVGGENVSPAEVEGYLVTHAAIAAAQVVGVPHPRLGEVVAAFVQLRDGASLAPDEVVAWARAEMAGFKAPRHVEIVPSFDDVMTGSGKPRKELLRARAAALFSGQDAA